MAQGTATSPEAIAEFRAHYLYSGNASESARAVGLEERTGRDIARKLIDDKDFSDDRRLLRRTALEELVAMRMRVSKKALERFEKDLEAPAALGDDAMVTIIDKRADYGKLVIDAEKNAQHLARFDAEKDGTVSPTREVVIRVKGPKGDAGDDG